MEDFEESFLLREQAVNDLARKLYVSTYCCYTMGTAGTISPPQLCHTCLLNVLSSS
jgi:hypothetical protein